MGSAARSGEDWEKNEPVSAPGATQSLPVEPLASRKPGQKR